MKQPHFILGTQYFRPPFPKPCFWEDDIKAMRDAGLNAVQFWVVWGWCEPEPGKYDFDDYERLADIAADNGMGVVLSTLPEINPFWVPRVYPDSLMVDIEGNRVLSGPRGECLSGMVPGSCSDHPVIRNHMIDFLRACGERFRDRDNMLAWDCWNENRWRNQAPDVVCFCEHSLAGFRAFLKDKYGSLEGLGEAWGRKHCDWADVRPGRLRGNCYPEMHDFTLWTCRRAADMARWRTEALRESDPNHPVSNHTGNPTIFSGVHLNENIFSRGIDWDIALGETYGFSSFPVSGVRPPMTPVEYCLRTSALSAVGGGKPVWMSEMQGGPTAHSAAFSRPIPGAEQQAWIWTGVSRGCRALILWCWKPEVFGNESNGFGFTGFDGMAEDRTIAMRRTAAVVAEHGEALEAYEPDPPEVGVLFQRDTYLYSWMRGSGVVKSGHVAPGRFLGYLSALERMNVPYTVHDDRHMPGLDGGLKVIIVPNPFGLDDAAAEWLAEFARRGGAVFVEGAAGCYGPDTFFRYPGDRPFYKAIGLEEELHKRAAASERVIPAGAIGNDEPIRILTEEVDVTFRRGHDGVTLLGPDDSAMLANVPVGEGRIIAIGSVLGARMESEAPWDMERLIAGLLKLGGVPRAVSLAGSDDGFCTFRLGRSGERRLLVLVNYLAGQDVAIRMPRSILPEGSTPADWFGHELRMGDARDIAEIGMTLRDYDYAVLEW